jgi:hypothetical protein
VEDPGENPRFWHLAGADDGDVPSILEGIIEVKLQAPSTDLWGKPQIHGSDDVGAHTSFSPLGASILEVWIDIDHWMVLW